MVDSSPGSFSAGLSSNVPQGVFRIAWSHQTLVQYRAEGSRAGSWKTGECTWKELHLGCWYCAARRSAIIVRSVSTKAMIVQRMCGSMSYAVSTGQA
eukprot:3195788-Rhodomonas_salina.4